jgi:hypothetical protein
VLVERDGAFGNAALVPHAEPDMWIVRQVSRHAKRLSGVARVRHEELDDLPALRSRAPRTEAETLLDVLSTARASRHGS